MATSTRTGRKSMAQVVSRARSIPRLLLSGGAAGDAATAKGRHIAFNVGVQLLARLAMMAISIVTVSLTARTLDPAGYGVWNGVSSYVGLFGVLTDIGLTMAALMRMSADPERESQWLGALVIARMGTSLVALALCAGLAPLLLSGDHEAHIVAFVMMVTILTVGASSMTTVFESRLRAGIMSTLNVLQSLLWLGGVAILAASNGSVLAFASVDSGLLVVMACVQLALTRRSAEIAWRDGAALVKPLIKAAVPLGLAAVAIRVYWQVDSVLLLELGGARESGVYGAAYGFLNPLIFLPAAVMSSLFPVVSAVHGRDAQRTRKLVQLGVDTMATIGLPVLAGALALAGPIIHLMYGSEFHEAAGLLPILMIAFVSICYGSLAGYLAPVLGLQWRLAAYSVIGALANVVLNVVLIPPFGAYGSAWATVATELMTMILMLSTVLHRMRFAPSPRKLIATLALAAAMTALMSIARPLGLIPAGAIGVAFYVTGLLGLRIVDVASLLRVRRQASGGADGRAG